ncbi:M56 family metallopeptidase [Cohnella laeviribosi]|uniref:M56 family metallopeptidase n=1 Tax=Cohnella laeviribosi TaxID=380174 RepID=UPI00036182E4|nr:M56 family metallopeptidase [Cohnella laeviribosi]
MSRIAWRVPGQPKVALLWIFILGFSVIVQLGYNVVHQIQDVPLKPNLFRLIMAVIVDSFSNHLLWELLLNGFVLFSLLVLGKQLIQQVRSYKRWKCYVDSNSNPVMTEYFSEKYKKENLRIEVVSDSACIAMTAGFFRPKILLSTGSVEMFNEQELESVIFHEMYHYKYRHPLQILILSIIAECLAFLPVIKGLVHHYKVWMELLADRYAIFRMGSEIQLAHVLLKMLKIDPAKPQAYAVHFANESVNYRLKQLIDPQTIINVPFFERKTLLPSIVVLVIMTTTFIYGCV